MGLEMCFISSGNLFIMTYLIMNGLALIDNKVLNRP